MSLLEAIVLGIIQGLTEFLPISSSGHLVIIPFLFGWSFPEEQSFLFGVLVQMGTLLAVIIYFRKDLHAVIIGFFQGLARKRPFETVQSRMGWYLILATIPAGLFGLLVKDQVEMVFNSPVASAIFLLITAGLLLLSERLGRMRRSLDHFNWKDALLMGIAQALSVFPGISRSGSTIAGGLARQLDRSAAARFSFLMSIPIMALAGLMASLDLRELPNLSSFLPILVVGFVTAAVVGYASIHWLLSFLVRHSLRSFALYCLMAAMVTLIVAYV